MQEILLITFTLLIAYFIRGVTGFGSGLIAVPALAHALPLQFVVPLVMSLDFLASFILGGIGSKEADWGEVKILLPFGILGALMGVFALLRFPSEPVLAGLGIFTCIFGLRNVIGIEPKGGVSRLWAVPTGLIGSAAGALFGTSAPPYIIYLTHRLQDKAAVRATFSWLFVMDGGFRLFLFATSGLLLQSKTLLAVGLGVIPMSAGLYLGNRVHINISRPAMLKFVGVVLVLSGLSLISRVLFSEV